MRILSKAVSHDQNPAHTGEELVLNAGQYLRLSGHPEEMSAFLADRLEVTPIDAVGNNGKAVSKIWLAESCQFLHSLNDASIMRRTKAQAENCAHFVFVQRIFDCSLRASMGETGLDLEPGRIYLSDEEVRIDCLKTAGLTEGVFVPKALLGYVSGTHPAFMDLSQNAGLLSALQLTLDQMFERLNARNTLDMAAFSRFIACLKLAIGSQDQDKDVRRRARDAMAGTIRRHIEQNLESYSLSTTSLLRQFGVSRASLYRMFEPAGGVRQYISDRRLYHAVLDLNKAPLRRGQINQISEKWGFSSSASFNRAVRREYGVTPGSLVKATVMPRFHSIDEDEVA